MSQIKIISTKVKVDSELFKVLELDVEGKAGRKKWYTVHREPVVYIFPLTSDYEVYLTSQYRYNHNKHVLDGIAGYVDDGEEPMAAAIRELKEEGGITAQKVKKIGEYEIGAGALKGKVYMYFAKGLKFGDTDFDDEEDIELVKMPIAQAVEKVISGEIAINACCLGILLLDKLKETGKI